MASSFPLEVYLSPPKRVRGSRRFDSGLGYQVHVVRQQDSGLSNPEMRVQSPPWVPATSSDE
jgi:hypothetical protein